MKLLKINLFIAICFTLAQCSSGEYAEYKEDFPNKVWKKDRTLVFNPNIKDLSKKYDLYLDFRHVYGFPFKDLKLNIERVSPSGETTSNEYTIKVRKNKEEYHSECSGDLCDLSTLLEENQEFPEKGEYSYKVTFDLPQRDKMHNVMFVGLVLKKSEN